jgi:carbonic anhydrase
MTTTLAPLHDFRADYFGDPSSLITPHDREEAGMLVWLTCSDTGFRVDELNGNGNGCYWVQNLGNAVPAHGTASTSTLSSLWFALLNYDVRHIVVCGHYPCSVLQSVVDRARSLLSPQVKPWFEPVMNTLRRHYAGLGPPANLQVAAQENVLLQLENLLTHQIIQQGLDENRFKLHGWLLGDSTHAASAYNPRTGQYEALAEAQENGSTIRVFTKSGKRKPDA